jgi:hypothetical protein
VGCGFFFLGGRWRGGWCGGRGVGGNFFLLETLTSDVEDTSNVEGIAWWAYCFPQGSSSKTKGEEEEAPVC